MASWVQCTQIRNGAEFPVYINLDLVMAIHRSEPGSRIAFLAPRQGDYGLEQIIYEIKETPAEVVAGGKPSDA